MASKSHGNGLLRRRWGFPSVVQRCVVLGSLGIALVQVASVALKRDFYQYDFRAVYLAEQLLASGKDPYAWEELLALSQRLGFAENNHPFLYPPHALAFYAPFALMSPALAYYVWLALNVACFSALFFMLVRSLRVPAMLAAPLLVLGMNSSLTACMRSGQLSLVTAVCITAASIAFQRDKRFVPAWAIWLGGIVKLHTLPLLGLLLLRRQRIAVGLALGLAACCVLGGKLLTPTLWASFELAAQHLTSTHVGPENGSTLNVVRSLLYVTGVPVDSSSVPISYGVLAVLLGAVGSFTCYRLCKGSEQPLLSAFLFGVLTWSLVLPRVMIYEWVFVLPALCFHLARISPWWARTTIIVFALFPGIYVRRYALGLDTFVQAQSLADCVLSFSNWLACLGTFAATVYKQVFASAAERLSVPAARPSQASLRP